MMPVAGGIADASAHRLPARMSDVDGVDERIAHHAADQADDAVGGQHARGREAVAGDRGALDVVDRFDQIVDAERNRGDENRRRETRSRKTRGRRPAAARGSRSSVTESVRPLSVMSPIVEADAPSIPRR